MTTKWMMVTEAAEYLRCSERFLRELLPEDCVPHIMFAGKALFHPDSLDRWLLRMEKQVSETEEELPEVETTQEARAVIACEEEWSKVETIIDEFEGHNDSFVQRLGRNIRESLEQNKRKHLSQKVYAQLSRWCHPKRDTKRERWTKQRARELSQTLFGKVIDRTKHPSYR